MAPSVSKNQGRRRLSKSSKPENILREKENIDPRSKEQSPTSSVKVPIQKITITPPSSVLHVDGCSIPRTEDSLYFISFSGCKHIGFHRQSKDPNRKFRSELEFYSPTSPTPVKVSETYFFDKPCLNCNPKASIPHENPKESFVASLEKSEKWTVSWPLVEPLVPDAIRRFGKFDFEDEQYQVQSKDERKVDGSDRAVSLRSYATTELQLLYVEDLRTPAEALSTPADHVDTPVEHSATPAEDLGVRAKGCGTRAKDLGTRAKDLGTPAKKTKARRRWRKVRIVSRL